MRPLTLSTSVLLLTALLGSHAWATSDAARLLLAQARQWEDRGRLDLAQNALEKLLAAEPKETEALTRLALIQLANGKRQAAQNTLNRLKSKTPNHPGIGWVEQMLRLTGPDQLKLRQARDLARSGKTDEAISAFNQLFANQRPEGDLAIEYWQLIARNNWPKARDGLNALVKREPSRIRYRLALASIYLSGPAIPDAIFAEIKSLASDPDAREPALAIWRRALMQAAADPRQLSWLRSYLALQPNDTGIRERLDEVVRLDTERRALLVHPAYRAYQEGQRHLDQGNTVAAAPLIEQAIKSWGGRTDVLEALGQLRTQQKRYDEARATFRKAASVDSIDNRAYWNTRLRGVDFDQLIDKSEQAVTTGQLPEAEQAALAAIRLLPTETAGTNALAQVRAAQNRPAEAMKLYKQVLQQMPANGTALAGMVGLYLARDSVAEARQFLASMPLAQQRALGPRFGEAIARVERAQANQMQTAGDRAGATAALERAMQATPDDPWLRFDLALLYTEAGRLTQARALMDELAQHPNTKTEVLYATALFNVRLREDALALAQLERIAPAERTADITRLQRRLWMRTTLARAEQDAASGRLDAARQRLQQAEEQLGTDSALAPELVQGWRTLGDNAHALALLTKLRKHSPTPTTELAYAILLIETGKIDQVPQVLEPLSSRSLSGDDAITLASIRADWALALSEQQQKDGTLDAAADTLTQLLHQQPDNIRALRASAKLELSRDRPEIALVQATQAHTLAPNDDEAHLVYADALLAIKRQDDAQRELSNLLDRRPPPDVAFRMRVIDRLAALGDTDLVDSAIASLRAEGAQDPRLSLYVARMAHQHNQPEAALANYREALWLSAPTEQRTAPFQPTPLPAPAANSARFGPLVPPSPLVLTPGKPAEATGIGTPAFHSLAADAGNGATIREAFANFIDQRTAVLDITTDNSIKTGGDGTSTLKMQEVSAQLRVPGPYSGYWFLRAEPTSLRAGSLQISSINQAWVNALAQGETVDDLRNRNLPIDYGNLYSLQTFGSLLLCGNDPSFLQQCPVRSSVQSGQAAQGTALALGFQNDNLRADIGHTPTTFPVNYFTSGLTWKGDLGPLWYSTDVARRPLSSSVLTYAGTQDPRTGMVWGGVRSTGVTLGLGYDVGGPWGIWSNVGWQKLTGQHVEDNTRQSAMAGLYWRVMDAPTHRLQLGINSVNFWYDKNLSEFTLGQGGYYSPQRYSSVSLPITWWQRGERWTLTTRAAVSYSNSLTKDAEYFPLNPDYQSQANNPIFSGGAGRGAGYSFLVSGEYQLQPRWVLGGRVELERSVNTNYQPNRATFYLRYHLEPSAKPLPWPPEALTPYSRF